MGKEHISTRCFPIVVALVVVFSTDLERRYKLAS
jgi:hypothetical protein